MSKKKQGKARTKTTTGKPAHQDSVVKEAWENMNNDMARIMPEFLSKRLQKREGKLGFMVILTIVELVVLGVVGKIVYDWFTG